MGRASKLIIVAVIAAGGGWYGWALWSPKPIVVVDGDTVKRGGVSHRLMGFDAPEVRRTRCKDEKAKGLAARSRLEQLLQTASSVSLQPTGKPDRWGRMLSRLTIDGVDVADIAVREGWGIRYNGGRDPKPDWCFVKPSDPPAPQRKPDTAILPPSDGKWSRPDPLPVQAGGWIGERDRR